MVDVKMNETLKDIFDNLRKQWKWFVGVGILLVIIGCLALANAFIATVASMYFFGFAIIVSGILEIIHAFQLRSGSNALFWGGCGIIYTIAGIAVIANPTMASSVLTLLLAIMFIFLGIVRIWQGIRIWHYDGSGWIIFSGILSLLLGILILSGWPINSLWIIGLFLGIDLLFQGWSYLLFGFAIRPKKNQNGNVNS